ncbi:methyltransferase domain-containing protein [Psychrobacter celer]|uniref:methyltransferase domain-containing protein n=1 Tax=Psychrobacter celer TaxID=306572 RepID=UPI002FE48FE1
MNAINYLKHNWGIKKALNNKISIEFKKITGSVVDLGCGLRPFERDILNYADTYTGVDWANSLHDTKADIIADLNQPLSIESESFDSVVSFEVLEHLSEPQMMLKEANRILRKGGVLILSMPFQWWIHEEPWDYQRFTRYGLEYQLKKAGFTDIVIEETTGFWLMWILKLNYQSMRLIRGPRLVKKTTKTFLVPFWFSNQWIAMYLDTIWREDKETAGYVVTARKPS